MTERTPLLVSDDEVPGQKTGSVVPGDEDTTPRGTRIVVPRRTVIVEPVLALYVLCAYPMALASQLYIYDKFLASMAEKEGINVTSAPGESPGCGENETATTEFLDRVQSHASQFNSLLMGTTGIPAFLVSLFLGPYSDKAGRKWALIPPLVGVSLKATCLVLIVTLKLDIVWLLLGALLDGFGGFFTMLVSACAAYLSDVTTPENRVMRLTIIEMCSLASLMLTPIGLGYVIQQAGYTYVFIAVLCGFTICLIYVIFFVPETIQKDPDEPVSFCTTNHIKAAVALYVEDDGSGRRWKLILLTLVFLCATLTGLNIGVDTLFVKNRPLCWDSVLVGIYTAVYAGVSAFGAIIIAKTLNCWVSDDIIAMVAILGGIGLNLYKSAVTSTTMMFFCSAFGMFNFLISPAIRSLLSKLVCPTDQGRLYGALGSVEVVGIVFGAVCFNLIYSKTLHMAAGFVFITMAMVLVIAAILTGVFIFKIRRDKPPMEILSETLVTAPEKR